VTACGKGRPTGGDKLLDGKKAELAAKVAPVVKAIAANPPVLTADGLTGAQGPFTAFPKGNTAVVAETDLKELRPGGQDTAMLHQRTRTGVDLGSIRIYGSIFFVQMAGWASDNNTGVFKSYNYADPAKAQALIDGWAGLKYVIVVRVLDVVKPELVTSTEFKPGHMTCEALVYDTTGAPHGGFRYEVTSDKEITASADRVDDAFAADMDAMQKIAFDQALAKIAPGSAKMDDFDSAGFGDR
jgi:hypothetical protein